jgi:membrane protein required for colicin V production
MFIDTLFLLLMVMAVYKGFSRGFIVAVFSFFAYFLGMAAALKLSASVAVYLQEQANLSGPWLPALSFLLVFVAVIFLVRWGAAFVRKAISMVLLGWVDKIAGVLLYALLYTFLLSIVLFYAAKLNIISPEAQAASSTFSFVAPLGPWFIDGLGKILPFFSDMFSQLGQFFGSVATQSS